MKVTPLLACLLTLWSSVASADDDSSDQPWSQRQAFDRDFALAVYGVGWTGPYEAGGIGFRARWEPFDRLGVEVFTDHLMVEDAEATRHDHPIGFNLYVPFQLSERWRVRPLFGFCTTFSFAHPDQAGVERIDDVHFGVHLGGGVEFALSRFVSVFFDAQGIGYVGHGRYSGGWAFHVNDQLDFWGVVEGKLGIQMHL